MTSPQTPFNVLNLTIIINPCETYRQDIYPSPVTLGGGTPPTTPPPPKICDFTPQGVDFYEGFFPSKWGFLPQKGGFYPKMGIFSPRPLVDPPLDAGIQTPQTPIFRILDPIDPDFQDFYPHFCHF